MIFDIFSSIIINIFGKVRKTLNHTFFKTPLLWLAVEIIKGVPRWIFVIAREKLRQKMLRPRPTLKAKYMMGIQNLNFCAKSAYTEKWGNNHFLGNPEAII